MKIKSIVAVMATVLLMLPAQAQYRPGIPSTPPDVSGWERFAEEATNTRYPKYDENYQKGKAIYRGKGTYPKFDYCLPDPEKAGSYLALNRKSLKAHRNTGVKDFVKLLYDCNAPGKYVLNRYSKDDAGLVVYYLHKRYKLRLVQNR